MSSKFQEDRRLVFITLYRVTYKESGVEVVQTIAARCVADVLDLYRKTIGEVTRIQAVRGASLIRSSVIDF